MNYISARYDIDSPTEIIVDMINNEKIKLSDLYLIYINEEPEAEDSDESDELDAFLDSFLIEHRR